MYNLLPEKQPQWEQWKKNPEIISYQELPQKQMVWERLSVEHNDELELLCFTQCFTK